MLLPLPGGGSLIDNPGMRELHRWASEEAFDEVFAEIAALAEACRFADCQHGSEPECAVQAALENGQVDPGRWQSYQKLEREVQHQARQQALHATLAQKKKWKVIHKAMRNYTQATTEWARYWLRLATSACARQIKERVKLKSGPMLIPTRAR